MKDAYPLEETILRRLQEIESLKAQFSGAKGEHRKKGGNGGIEGLSPVSVEDYTPVLLVRIIQVTRIHFRQS